MDGRMRRFSDCSGSLSLALYLSSSSLLQVDLEIWVLDVGNFVFAN